MTFSAAGPSNSTPVQQMRHTTGHRAEPDHNRPRSDTLMSLFGSRSFAQHFQPNSTILLDGTPADALYLIVSGTVRCCTISEDGQRQIFRFAQSGEFLGIADIETWHFTGEAVDHVILKSIPRGQVERALATNPDLRREMRAHICAQLETREKQLLSLVTTRAPERLLQFLSEFAATRASTGYISLPMGRRDIAEHLGMSVETVSRAFTVLKDRHLIDLACAEKFKVNAAA